MTIQIECPSCRATFRVIDSRAGSVFSCLSCQEDIPVPEEQGASGSRQPFNPWIIVAVVVLVITVVGGAAGYYVTRFMTQDLKKFDERIEAKKTEQRSSVPVIPDILLPILYSVPPDTGHSGN